MSDNYFIDSNIGLYLFDNDLKKAQIANNLFTTNAVISTQVLGETANVLIKKFRFSSEDAIDAVRFIMNKVVVKTITPELFDTAFIILVRYNFSFYDSMIIASALDSGCSKLYSEDLHHQQLIENKLTIVNPFVLG